MSKQIPTEKKPKVLQAFLLVVCLVGVGGLGYSFYDRLLNPPGAMPRLEIRNVLEDQTAGYWNTQKGGAFLRPAGPKDSENFELSRVPSDDLAAQSAGWELIQPKQRFYLETLFYVRPSSSLSVITNGNWIVHLDDGEFLFWEAKRDEKDQTVTEVWIVKQGLFRALVYSGSKRKHWLEVRTPRGKVVVEQGEIGLKVGENGSTQFWVMSGAATAFKRDGTSEKVELRGLKYL